MVTGAPHPFASATKSLDQSSPLTSYSQPWSPQDNAFAGSAAARLLPLGVLPARLASAQLQLAIVARDSSLLPVAQQLMTDLGSRYGSFNASLPGFMPTVQVPPLSQVMRTFSSEAELEAYITSPSYRNVDVKKIWAAVVINGAPPQLDYTIRMNVRWGGGGRHRPRRCRPRLFPPLPSLLPRSRAASRGPSSRRSSRCSTART